MVRSKKIYSGPLDLRNRRTTVYASRRMIVQFEMNRRGIAQIAVGDDLRAAVRSVVVNKAMPYAIQISPTGDTLDYVSSWKAVDTHEVIAGMRRVACRLWNTSSHAAAVEWVSRRGFGHGYHVLGRTLAHLNSTSPLGVARAARAARSKASWDPKMHPRGPQGRFSPKAVSPDVLRERARRAAERGPNP